MTCNLHLKENVFQQQEGIISSRQRLEDAVAASFRSSRHSSSHTPPPGKAEVRTGVAPGAFPGLLERTLDPTGGGTLSEEVRIQQVGPACLFTAWLQGI